MKYRLCMGAGMGFDMPLAEQVPHIAAAGFGSVFADDGAGFPAFAAEAAREGLVLQSIHAPFGKMHLLWERPLGDAEADGFSALLAQSITRCAEYGAPIVIFHAIIGMERHSPTELGLARLEPLVALAEKLGVKIAFENTEGEEYLAAVMRCFAGSKAVGFCLDTGHELCYNGGRDMLALYGERLIATHLNDNMGQTGKTITFYDDAHLLPFDGVADWPKLARRLKACGYFEREDTLTFELMAKNRPGRTVNNNDGLGIDEYLAKAYAAAVRFAALAEE